MRHFLTCMILLTGIISNAQTKTASQQSKYLPKELKGLYIGMNTADLQSLHPNAKVPDNSVMGYPEESFAKGDIKNITYQTMSDSAKVYEFIIEYRSTAKAIAIAKQLYKKPNDVSGKFPLAWEFKTEDGLTLKIWIYKNKICIIDGSQF